jgi:hypothetical protein
MKLIAGKIILAVFSDMESAILVHFTSKGPDFAPSDFHMFGPVKDIIRGRRFSSDEDVIGAVLNWLRRNEKTFSLAETYEMLEPVRGITLKSNIKFRFCKCASF